MDHVRNRKFAIRHFISIDAKLPYQYFTCANITADIYHWNNKSAMSLDMRCYSILFRHYALSNRYTIDSREAHFSTRCIDSVSSFMSLVQGLQWPYLILGASLFVRHGRIVAVAGVMSNRGATLPRLWNQPWRATYHGCRSVTRSCYKILPAMQEGQKCIPRAGLRVLAKSADRTASRRINITYRATQF